MIRAKIICTIGPVSESYEMLKRMAGAGMNIARLNMSHGDHEWHHKVIRHIKTLNRQIPTPIAVLLDTQGPEIRINFSEDPEKTLQTPFTALKEREGFQSKEKVVVISDVLAGSGKIDAIQIRQLP